MQGDTAQVQFGRGTYGARSAVVGGSALKRAADAIIDKAKPMAAAMMEADAGDIEFNDGTFKVAGTDKAIPLTEVAKASFAPMGPMTKFGIGLEGSGSHSPEPPSHPNGAHAVEVEIDPETGEVTVDRYVMVDDLGQVLNPMIVNGQQHGGVAQGIGQALYEHAVYDRDSAQLVTGSFMDYVMPRADMLPNFEIALEEVPCLTNPIGVKGIGESGTIGAPPVVINAIIDALSPLGIDRIDMPATPGKVWAGDPAAKGARRRLVRLDHALARDRAAIHLVFEIAHRRPGVVPGQAGARRAAAHDLVGEERMQVVHRVDLRGGRVGPAEAEQRQPPLHLAQHVARLFAHRVRRGFAEPHRVIAVLPLPSSASPLPATTKVGSGPLRRDREAERMERRLGRRVDLGAHIAARHRIGVAGHHAPFAQRPGIDFVERAEPVLGERRGRAQLAGAERRRAAGRPRGSICSMRAKPSASGTGRVEAHAHDLEARLGRDAARILEDRRDVAIAARRERSPS